MRRPFWSAILVALTLLSSPVAASAIEDPPPGAIAGTVTVPAGASAADVYVTARDDLWSSTNIVSKTTFVDEDGSYRIEGLPPGDYHLKFTYNGPEPVLSEYWQDAYKKDESVPLKVVAGGQVSANAVLDTGAVLTVHVTEDGGPVTQRPHFSIVATGDTYEYGPPNVLHGYWDGEKFKTWPLIPGTFEFVIDGARWFAESRTVAVGVGEASDVSLEAAGVAEATVDLTIRSTVAGTVGLSAAESGVVAIGSVWLRPAGNPLQWEYHGQVRDGQYAIDGVLPGEYYVHFQGQGGAIDAFWPDAESIEEAAPISIGETDHLTVDATLELGGWIEGRVLGPGGTKAPATDMSLWRYDEGSNSYHPVEELVTDSAFTTLVKPGIYSVYARPRDEFLNSQWYESARYFAQSLDVEVTAGSVTVLDDMTLAERTIDVFPRVAGQNRFATAVAVTQMMYPTDHRAPVIYLVDAHNFPDALAAGPAAAAQGGRDSPRAQRRCSRCRPR